MYRWGLNLVRGVRTILCGWVLVSCAWAHAAAPNISDLFRDAQVTSARLSPSGRYLALTTAVPDGVQLLVTDLQQGSTSVVLRQEDTSIADVQWLDDDYLHIRSVPRLWRSISVVLSSGPVIVKRTGGIARPIHGELISGPLEGDPGHVMVLTWLPGGEAQLRRMDIDNGRSVEPDYLSQRIARDFVVDHRGRARVVITSNDTDSQRTVWYRDLDVENWRALATFPRLDPTFIPLDFDHDNRTLFVSVRNEKGIWGVHVYDFANNRVGERIASDAQVDVGGALIHAPDSRKVLGVRVQSDPPRTLWLDPYLQTLQQQIDAASPGMVNVIHPGNTGVNWLVTSYSSTRPARYALYDHQTRKLKLIRQSRPWIDTGALAQMHVYDYVARDGLPITAYLTLPRGQAPKGLPLVVLVHDGAWDRDAWGFDPEVQFLAAMGYAVLQPQFRGSRGFGDSHQRKGFKQWGLAMQDDLSDGVASLTRQGVVDPKRVSIMGFGSYAGYAALMGLVKDPDQYRCAIDLFGISNLFEVASSTAFYSRTYNYSADEVLGNPKALREQFTATSPNLQATRIKAPVFMVYGHYDVNHGTSMRAALESAGKAHEYLRLEHDEIGLRSDQVRLKVYGAIEAFLRRHNPP